MGKWRVVIGWGAKFEHCRLGWRLTGSLKNGCLCAYVDMCTSQSNLKHRCGCAIDFCSFKCTPLLFLSKSSKQLHKMFRLSFWWFVMCGFGMCGFVLADDSKNVVLRSNWNKIKSDLLNKNQTGRKCDYVDTRIMQKRHWVWIKSSSGCFGFTWLFASTFTPHPQAPALANS